MPILLPRNQAGTARLLSARRSSEYLAAHMAELREKHAGKFVAVHNGVLVGIGTSATAALEDAVHTKGAIPDETIVTFVPRPGSSFFY